MKKHIITVAVSFIVLAAFSSCSKEKSVKDRSAASEMFARICSLTEEYTERLSSAPDSVDWAATCAEFEAKLDKISLSYPPDTDLLLTEGQNDTIQSLLQSYVEARSKRLHGLTHPAADTDSVAVSDSLPEAVEVIAADAG